MFFKCHKLKEIKGINNFKTNNISSLKGMFYECYELEFLDLSNFSTEKVIAMDYMFHNCKKLKEVKGLEKINCCNVINIEAMFEGCIEIEYLDLSNFNTSNVTNMGGLFSGCNKLKEIKGINYFNTIKVTNMRIMLQGAVI